MAIPSPMVMPFRPPTYEPTIIKKKVITASRNVVRRTLIAFPQYSLRPEDAKHNSAGNLREEGPFEVSSLASLDSCSCRWLFLLRALEAHCVILPVAIHSNMISRQHLTFEDLHCQRILNQTLNRSPQRSCAVRGVVAFSQQQLFRRRR